MIHEISMLAKEQTSHYNNQNVPQNSLIEYLTRGKVNPLVKSDLEITPIYVKENRSMQQRDNLVCKKRFLLEVDFESSYPPLYIRGIKERKREDV